MQSLSDEQVMLRYQNGEVYAMDELIRRYQKPVYRFVCRLSCSAAEAEDIAQEVFLRVHQSKDTYRPIGKFSTWIFSIAHNLNTSRLRKTKWFGLWPVQDEESLEPKEFASPDPSPQEAASSVEETDIV